MTLQNSDDFTAYRDDTSYKLEADKLMATLLDDDLMVVNRGGESYKATGQEIKAALAPAEVPPYLVGATLAEDNASGDRFSDQSFTSTLSWATKGIPQASLEMKATVTGTLDIAGATDEIVGINNQNGITSQVPQDLTGDWLGILGVNPSDTSGASATFPDGGGTANSKGTFFWTGMTVGEKITWYGTASGSTRNVIGDINETTVTVPGNSLASFQLTVNASSGSAKIDFNGAATCYGLTPGGVASTLTLASDANLANGAFKAGDVVKQDNSPFTPTTSPITNVVTEGITSGMPAVSDRNVTSVIGQITLPSPGNLLSINCDITDWSVSANGGYFQLGFTKDPGAWTGTSYGGDNSGIYQNSATKPLMEAVSCPAGPAGKHAGSVKFVDGNADADWLVGSGSTKQGNVQFIYDAGGNAWLKLGGKYVYAVGSNYDNTKSGTFDPTLGTAGNPTFTGLDNSTHFGFYLQANDGCKLQIDGDGIPVGTVLTLTNSDGLSDFEVGDVVQSNWNQRQVWSDNAVLEGSYHGVDYGVEKLFDGTLTGVCLLKDNNSNITVNIDPPLAFTDKIEVYYTNGVSESTFEVNGVDQTFVVNYAERVWQTIQNISSPFSSIKFTGTNAIDGPYVYAIRVDGVLLVNPNIPGAISFSITDIDESVPSITTDGGTWLPGQVVTGPPTDITATFVSADPSAPSMQVSNLVGPWSANTGNYVVNTVSNPVDIKPETSPITDVEVDGGSYLKYTNQQSFNTADQTADKAFNGLIAEPAWYCSGTGGNAPDSIDATSGFYWAQPITCSKFEVHTSGGNAWSNFIINGTELAGVLTLASSEGWIDLTQYLDDNGDGTFTFEKFRGMRNGSSGIYGWRVDGEVLVEGVEESTLTLTDDTDLNQFVAGDDVYANQEYTPVSSAITGVSPDGLTLTLTDDTDLANFRVGDPVSNNNAGALTSFEYETGDTYGFYDQSATLASDSSSDALNVELPKQNYYNNNVLDTYKNGNKGLYCKPGAKIRLYYSGIGINNSMEIVFGSSTVSSQATGVAVEGDILESGQTLVGPDKSKSGTPKGTISLTVTKSNGSFTIETDAFIHYVEHLGPMSKVTSIDAASNLMTVDGGTWGDGDVVTGPTTTATGTVVSTENNTMTLLPSNGRWVPGTKVTMDEKPAVETVASLIFDSNGAVSGMTTAARAGQLMSNKDTPKLTFTSPGTGKTWDEELPAGTTIQTSFTATNDSGTTSAKSNVVTPGVVRTLSMGETRYNKDEISRSIVQMSTFDERQAIQEGEEARKKIDSKVKNAQENLSKLDLYTNE